MTASTATTNHRILLAVLRLLAYGDLPQRAEVEKLAEEPTTDAANFLTHVYLSLAETENLTRNEAEYRAPHLAAERLVSCAMYAAYLGYDLRRAAQGDRGPDPAMHVWCLLNAVLTLLVVRTADALEREALRHQVTTVALTLSEQ